MIERRSFCIALGAMALPASARAQTAGRVYRLGVIHPAQTINAAHPFGKLIVKGLAAAGFTLDQNLTLDPRTPMGDLAKIPALLQQLQAAGADAIITSGYPAAAAARSLGVPIVSLFGGDPVATGLIESLARPGGHVTGMFDDVAALSSKRLALLKEISPSLRKVAMLWNRDDLGMTLRFQATAKMAQSLGLDVQSLGVREPDDFGQAFAQMDKDRPDGVLMVTDALTVLNRRRVFEFAAARKLPAIYEFELFARDGGLMSYGSDMDEAFERAAALAARIFKGEKPADLPFEQATRYQLAINLKTAAALGLDVPLSVIARADEVIE